jgi:hypothetical protein
VTRRFGRESCHTQQQHSFKGLYDTPRPCIQRGLPPLIVQSPNCCCTNQGNTHNWVGQHNHTKPSFNPHHKYIRDLLMLNCSAYPTLLTNCRAC